MDLTDVSLRALTIYSKDIDPLDPDNEISITLFHASMLHTLAKRLQPDLLDLVDQRIRNWQGLKELFDDFIPEAEKAWEKKDLSDIWRTLEEQTYYRPFSDLGQFRSIEYHALGITWRFKWENTYELTALAEEIVAVVQIILADIANTDWYLLRTTVEVEICLGSDNELHQMPSNEMGQWRLVLTGSQTDDDSNLIALQLATTLLEHASLLPSENYLKKIEVAFQKGLSHKIFFGQRYSTLYREFITKDKFENSNRARYNIPEFNRPFKPALHHQLEWHGGLGPNYSEESARQALKNRYENSVRPVQLTLKWLTQQQPFIDAVNLLRAEGWLDWHILNATSLIVLNHRINKEIQ